MTTLIVIGCIFLHFAVGGYAFSSIQGRMEPKCNFGRYGHGDCMHTILACVSVVLWPVVLPVSLGVTMGSRQGNRRERRYAKEIAEAKHKAELARIKRLEEEETTRRIEAMK